MSTKPNTEQSLVKGVLKHGPEVLENCLADAETIEIYQSRLAEEFIRGYPSPKIEIDTSDWFMPEEYKNMDIEGFLVDQCPKENYDRLIRELEIYRERNLIPLLRMMKYIVDTLRSNRVLWGVGRGSSVASYVLFLLGVHRIDSVKYSLPIEEFFKGEQNG
jgi:DNA polymerase III alpha subunit